MVPTFTPPTIEDVPALDAATVKGPAFRLFRHYRNGARGRNVYLLDDGTITESQPDETVVDGVSLSGRTITRTYWGGHVETITEAEKTALIAAGYEAYIT